MDWFQHRTRLAVISVAATVLVVFAIRDAKMAAVSFDPGDFLLVFAIYGIPFLVFAFMIWTGRWSELSQTKPGLTARQRIAFAAEITGAIASGMCLLTLPLWSSFISHEAAGGLWTIVGVFTSIVGVLGALAGSPRLWRHAIASALLLPFWVIQVGLLVKAIQD